MNAPAPVVIKYQGSGDSAVNANQMLPRCYPVSFLKHAPPDTEGGRCCQHIITSQKGQTKEPVLSSDISEIQYVI